jgi:hypothetical protein
MNVGGVGGVKVEHKTVAAKAKTPSLKAAMRPTSLPAMRL